MVKESEDFHEKRIQSKIPVFTKGRCQKARVLQAGFAYFEGIFWTSLIVLSTYAFIKTYWHIKKDSIREIQEFAHEWNKIKI